MSPTVELEIAELSEISDWLATQGLERFASAFTENEIDLATLTLLTDEDLREIGIPLGPRRRILSLVEVPSATSPDEPVGERRQITVMFVDLVGSTNLSTRVDPEIMRDLLASYKKALAEEIALAGGTVAKYLGDGVLAYFGWPKAREDAAECAVRCAFQIRERIAQLREPSGKQLKVRTGIATGLVVVGGTTGKGNAREDEIAGEVLNLAARMQALAEPDEICVSARVRELVGGAFEFEFAGEHALKGFDDPVSAWRPIRHHHFNRFASRQATKHHLIGRDQELESLVARWFEVSRGKGRAVLIIGEAGIGKSRLLDELHNAAGATPHVFMNWQCSAFHQTKPLYPVIERLTRDSDVIDSDDPATRLAKLRVTLDAAGVDLENALPLFAELLAIPADAGYAPSPLNPTQRRAATIAAIGDWLRRIAEERPLLLSLEDAHWADATTLEVASLLINGISNMPLMAVVTGRPEFASPWSGRPNVSVIGLDRLTDSDCEGLIREILPADDVAIAAIRQILEHSDGNPLFIEELSAAFAGSGSHDRQAVPDSLQSSLMARLDQLGDAKRTAQLCSVLGRQFARPLLSQLYDASPALLDTNLSLLIANDVVHPLGRSSEGRYQFKHALLRDAAYESLLLSDRRRLHERCVRQLECNFIEVVDTEPELLAYHCRLAGLSSEAAAYLERSGDRASSGAAYVEAIASYRGAINELAKLTVDEARDRRELAVLLKLGPALTIIDGAQGASVRETYERANQLGRDVKDPDGRFKGLWGLWYNANVGRDYDRAGQFAEELVLLSEETQDDSHVLEALHCRWSSAMFRGECTGSISDAARGIKLYRPDLHHRLAAMFGGHDPGVCAHGVAGSSQVTAGQFAEAMDNVTRAVELARELDHPHSVAHALMVGLSVSSSAGKFDQVREWASDLAEVAERYNFPPLRAVAAFFSVWEQAQTSSCDSNRLRHAFEKAVAIGPLTLLYIALYSEELHKAGEDQEAIDVIDHFVGALKFPAGYYLPEIYRVRGSCLAALGRDKEAIEQLKHAEHLAAEQESELFALRAAAVLSECCSLKGERAAARRAARRALAAIGSSDWPEITVARDALSAEQ